MLADFEIDQHQGRHAGPIPAVFRRCNDYAGGMNSSINQHMGWLEWLALIGLSILWGGSFYFNEVALTELSTLVIVASRVLIAAAVIWLLVLAMRYPIPRSAAIWQSFLVMGLINNALPFSLIVWGQKQLVSGLASILNAAAPIFAVVIAGLVLKDEPLRANKVGGALLGVVGVIVLIGPSALGGLDANVAAQLAVLLAALSYAVAGVYGRRFKRLGVHPVVAAAGQLTLSSALMIALALVVDGPAAFALPSGPVIGAVLGLALLSTALAYILYFRLLGTAGATNLMLVTLLIPVTAIILGSALLDEKMQWTDFAGMAVIALGLIVIDGRLFRRADTQ